MWACFEVQESLAEKKAVETRGAHDGTQLCTDHVRPNASHTDSLSPMTSNFWHDPHLILSLVGIV